MRHLQHPFYQVINDENQPVTERALREVDLQACNNSLKTSIQVLRTAARLKQTESAPAIDAARVHNVDPAVIEENRRLRQELQVLRASLRLPVGQTSSQLTNCVS